MRYINLAPLVALLAAVSARAGEAEIRFPVKLLCEFKYKDGSVDKSILYPRLGKLARWDDISSDKAKPTAIISAGQDEKYFDDETRTGDQLAISLTRESYFYSQTACDTEERHYHFDTHELSLPVDSKAERKKVGGLLRTETRGDKDEYPLECEAVY